MTYNPRLALTAATILFACSHGAASAQVISAQTALGAGVLPMPSQVTAGNGEFLITKDLAITEAHFHDARLDAAVARTLEQLRRKTGLPLAPATPSTTEGQFVIDVGKSGEAVQSPGEDESYTLTVSPAQILLQATTVVGAMRGLSTLVQLVQSSGSVFQLPAVTIQDSPRFKWRGLMVDCARHFEPVSVLKRTLDGMAAVKLNVFHWHLTDDQGFRIESKVYPELTARGSDGLYYTQEEAAEIVQYARARGIRVVPEFEMPGHSTAWLVAYPNLASGQPPKEIRREFGISDVALDPTREETYVLLKRFLTEMAPIFPDSYVHIGGDETASPDWKSDPRIQGFMRAHELTDSNALQAYFNGRVLLILTQLHKHMVGWDEILNPALPRDVVVQSWRGEDSLVQGARQGYQGILSAGYYLDAMKPAGELYLVDPLPSTTKLSTSQRNLVLGGEICMFAEQINEHTIDSRIWPRAAAVAERFWSPEAMRDVDDMYRRLDRVSVELEALGLHQLTQEDASLRELAGRQDIADLRIFASVLEPVSFHERYQQQKTDQLTVLDRFVDTVRPDPPSRHQFERLTTDFLAAPRSASTSAAELVAMLSRVQSALPGVQAQLGTSPLLQEMKPRADQLQELVPAGLEAIRLVSSGNKAPVGWKSKAIAEIEAARKPSAIVRFTFLESLTKLVNAVQE